jgi:hypothetical protein
MSTGATAARVNGETLRQHIGGVVRIVGEVIDSTSDPLTIKATDGATVVVHRRAADPLEHWVEVTGRLQADCSIVEDFTVPFTGEIDREAWNQMVSLMHRYDEIFT